MKKPSGIVQLAREIIKMDMEIGAFEKKLEEIKGGRKDTADRLQKLMEAAEMQAVQVDGQTVQRIVNMYPRIVDDQKFLAWLDSTGNGDLAKRTVHHQTLKGWYWEKSKSEPGFEAKVVKHGVDLYAVAQIRVGKVKK